MRRILAGLKCVLLMVRQVPKFERCNASEASVCRSQFVDLVIEVRNDLYADSTSGTSLASVTMLNCLLGKLV